VPQNQQVVPRRHHPIRPLLFLLGIVLATGVTPAAAQNYPWCSNFADGAGTNCGFTSYEQCMGTARGTGGYCEKNNMYRPPAAATPSQRRSRNHHAHKNS
jgi:hypothetical protein